MEKFCIWRQSQGRRQSKTSCKRIQISRWKISRQRHPAIKNGPLDFQPREPYAPIFDNIHQTPQIAELQITQEYLGQSKHLVYLAPMWKEFFRFVSPDKLKGIAGVSNIGDNANWCGHPFSQANWYAFGRLAWNPSISSEEIAHEWLIQTYECKDERFTNQ